MTLQSQIAAARALDVRLTFGAAPVVAESVTLDVEVDAEPPWFSCGCESCARGVPCSCDECGSRTFDTVGCCW